jgi:hypothetical protein
MNGEFSRQGMTFVIFLIGIYDWLVVTGTWMDYDFP